LLRRISYLWLLFASLSELSKHARSSPGNGYNAQNINLALYFRSGLHELPLQSFLSHATLFITHPVKPGLMKSVTLFA
jgi:hypothetical protein